MMKFAILTELYITSYLVLWRAAFTAKDTQSNRFPPHSNTYKINTFLLNKF